MEKTARRRLDFENTDSVLTQKRKRSTKETENEYKQKMVWCQKLMEKRLDIMDAEQMFLDEFGARMKYIGTIVTRPGMKGEGGRHDAVFYIHSDDILNFGLRRFRMGDDRPIWWEDYTRIYKDVIPDAALSEFSTKQKK